MDTIEILPVIVKNINHIYKAYNTASPSGKKKLKPIVRFLQDMHNRFLHIIQNYDHNDNDNDNDNDEPSTDESSSELSSMQSSSDTDTHDTDDIIAQLLYNRFNPIRESLNSKKGCVVESRPHYTRSKK